MNPPKVKKTSGTKATWKAPGPAEHGRLDAAEVNLLPGSAFAFPRSRKEPMTDGSHVRNAIARFDQVKDVSDAERDLAFANIKRDSRAFWCPNEGNGLAPARLAVPRVEAAVWTKMR